VWLLDSVPADSVVYQEGGQVKVRSIAERERMIGHEGGSGI